MVLMFCHCWLAVSVEGLMHAEQIRNSLILGVVGYSVFLKRRKKINRPPLFNISFENIYNADTGSDLPKEKKCEITQGSLFYSVLKLSGYLCLF